MKEKIVVLGNGEDWCEKSLTDFKKMENVKIINRKYLYNFDKFASLLIKIHFSYKLNKIVNLPFKYIWIKKVMEAIDIEKTDNQNIIFIIYDRSFLSNNISFLKCLRKKYINCKLVYMFTNIVNISGASDNNFVSKLSEYYDIVYAFDPEDAKKYNFKYSPLLYSLNPQEVEEKEQVFYVGRAKDRYSMLIETYEKIKELNIDRNFYIFGVPEKEQKYVEDIKYNKYISYDDCLKKIQQSNCLIDIIQSNSCGFTIKTCEAVYYDKLLITTNENVKQAPFYDERYILVINSAEDITKEFFENAKSVKYSDEGKAYFSIEKYLNVLYEDLDIEKER